MKILAISSSPRRNGNTSTLIRESLRGAKDNGADVEEIFLLDYNIEHCKGCFSCMATGKCPIPDDFEGRKDAKFGRHYNRRANLWIIL